MFKLKSLGIIALCAFTFTFMTYSNSNSNELYSASYYSIMETTSESDMQEVVWVGAVARLAVVASRRAVAYTREAVRQASPALRDAARQASIFTANLDRHSHDYAMSIENLKLQQIRSLN